MLTAAVGAAAAPSAGFVPGTPARLVDTRPHGETIDGIDRAIGVLEPGRVLDVVIAGRAAVPRGAKAAALTFTVTDPVDPGFLTVWPCGAPKPTASMRQARTSPSLPLAFGMTALSRSTVVVSRCRTCRR